MAKAPPNPPRPPTTSGRRVDPTASRMRSTARSPAATSTPERAYASRTAGNGLLEDELARCRVVRDGLRVAAVEAREAEPLVRQVERGEHAPNRQIAER